MNRTKLLFIFFIFVLLLSGCSLFANQQEERYYQRDEGDILRQYTTYIPLVINAETVPLGTAMHPGFMWDKRYTETIDYYDHITPEVAGGYWWVIGGDGYPAHGWADMDATYQYALDTGRSILSYPLRWWFPNGTIQPPDIAVWITTTMDRYPLITDWIVVNEGWDYYGNQTIPLIDESFIIARETRPDAVLWYNGLLDGSAEQQQVIRLVQLNLVDAIGIQMHLNLNSNMDMFLPFLLWLDENNITWAVTELDVSIPNDTPEMFLRQAEMYAKVYQLCLEYECERITTWGFSDNVSWLRQYYPLPFDRMYQPKPAWWVLTTTER